MFHRHNVYDLLGVSGPGDEWTSSGPGGMTSLQAQQKAAQPPQDDSFLGGFFGGSEDDGGELMTAEAGAADAAADAVVHNVFDDEGQIQHGQFVPSGGGGGGGGGGGAHTVAPVDIEGAAPSSSGGTSKALLIALAAGVGLYVAFGK